MDLYCIRWPERLFVSESSCLLHEPRVSVFGHVRLENSTVINRRDSVTLWHLSFAHGSRQRGAGLCSPMARRTFAASTACVRAAAEGAQERLGALGQGASTNHGLGIPAGAGLGAAPKSQTGSPEPQAFGVPAHLAASSFSEMLPGRCQGLPTLPPAPHTPARSGRTRQMDTWGLWPGKCSPR